MTNDDLCPRCGGELERANALEADLTAEREKVKVLRAALTIALGALADIGDADREPGDDLAWCERRAASVLPRVRHALGGKR